MITKISMQDVASYGSNPVVLDNLKKVNYIYASNGSGKTTLSRFIKTPYDEKYASCSMESQLSEQYEYLTYNSDFREHNFSSTIPGIFTLGENSKDLNEQIKAATEKVDQLMKEKSKLKETRDKLIEEKTNAAEKLKKYLWAVFAEDYKPKFKEAFKGYLSNKQLLCDNYINKSKGSTICNLKLSEMEEQYQVLFNRDINEIESINIIDFSPINSLISDIIWKTRIVGSEELGISKFITTMKISDWVKSGVDILQKTEGVCPFCQQSIDISIQEQLLDLFDENFTEQTKRIDLLKQRYLTYTNDIEEYISSLIQHFDSSNIISIEELKQLNVIINQTNKLNIAQISSKINEPSKTIDLSSVKEQIITLEKIVKTANQKIDKQNSLVRNRSIKQNEFKLSIWSLFISSTITNAKDYIDTISSKDKGLENIEKKLVQANQDITNKHNEITALNKRITSVKPTIDNINSILNSYNFTNFRLVLHGENEYQICRNDGTIVGSTLSEGEVTFITFLYFYQLAMGGNSAEECSKNKVLVIDDPISSLDSTVLFVVSTLIKKFIKEAIDNSSNIKQVIVMTHNVYFYKEVSSLEDKYSKKTQTFSYWVLRKQNNHSTIKGYDKNPIRGNYELLWSELKEESREELSNITIQNTMRRIIEIYFKTMGAFSTDNILAKFDDLHEREVARSLMHWYNDGSHCIEDELCMSTNDNAVEHYFPVFKLIFEKMGHIEHFNMMMPKSYEQVQQGH